jgi:hypothetical protein
VLPPESRRSAFLQVRGFFCLSALWPKFSLLVPPAVDCSRQANLARTSRWRDAEWKGRINECTPVSWIGSWLKNSAGAIGRNFTVTKI